MSDPVDLMSQQRWPEAADAFLLAGEPNLARLCRNMHAMQLHRPEVYERLLQASPADRCTILAGEDGLLTVQIDDADGRFCLSPESNPRLSVTAARESMQESLQAGTPIGLQGVGDGYALAYFAAQPQRYMLDRQQAIYLFEPDVDLLAAVLMIHDFTGPAGPIEQQRIFWFVGPDCVAQFEKRVHADMTLTCPLATLRQHTGSQWLDQQLQDMLERFSRWDRQTALDNDAYYGSLPIDHLQRALAGQLGRPARALVLTTRFSTVLQYSSIDTADGLDKLGLQTRVLIEPHAWHGLTPVAIRQAVAEFRPDMVIQIDHLRHEHGNLFPAGLPFVCWIQDHKQQLTDPQSGPKVDDNQFVLTGARFRYTKRHNYPPRQVIDMPKVTRPVSRPTRWVSDGDDIAYVSHWSHVPGTVMREAADSLERQFGLGKFMRACCDEMTRFYDSGQFATAEAHLYPVVLATEQQTETTLTDEQRQYVVYVLFERLNNALYRQQSLAWTASYAARNNLKFRIFGRGWQDHSAFCQYAAGPVRYGQDLEDLTRRTKVMLNIEPYACFTHQRMLDGLMAGGFFVVREHPFNTLLPKLGQFVRHQLPQRVDSTDGARAACPPTHRERLEELLREASILQAMGDPIEILRSYINASIVPDTDQALPHLADVSFNTEAQLAARLDRFLHDPDARRSISESQFQSIGDRLTYQSAWQRALGVIADRSATRSRNTYREAA